ncbi:outer membrane protein transport protein [Moraxella bovis]|uniref:Outer membrane protein transport protein n=1 Tax=Moraxella bovis TaxID=476 RepID=A0ABY6M5P2_MORBO|nr:outer membrane protein transport protein [Moraxella bovis]UZA02370.1 outer membrane protein transport protein [Moraxella bovis]
MFNYKHLAVAIASIGAVGVANAAGLDRSGQDITAFLQDGTYGEVVYTYIDADVSGKDISGRSTGDIAEAYDFARFGVKADINDTFSVGVLYDEPWGAAVQYGGDNNFVSKGADDIVAVLSEGKVGSVTEAQAGLAQAQQGITQLQTAIANVQAAGGDTTALQTQLTQAQAQAASLGQLVDASQAMFPALAGQQGQGTNVEIRTQNATLLMGAKLGQNKNFQVYGGPALQRLTGEVHLRGNAYQRATGYDAKISTDTTTGWVAGVAYHKPEIALKAALTYRSETEHESNIAEVFPTATLLRQNANSSLPFSVTLPESWNLDFQTGVNPTTLLTAKVRYVPWSDFDIRPTRYTQLSGLPIISYDKDQWSAEVGLGKKLNDKLAVSGSVGYDSGAGNPVSTLGPIKGYYSLGLGAKYNVTPEWSVSVGGKYLKFGNATAQLPNGVKVGEFDDNDGFIAGVKLAYQQK